MRRSSQSAFEDQSHDPQPRSEITYATIIGTLAKRPQGNGNHHSNGHKGQGGKGKRSQV